MSKKIHLILTMCLVLSAITSFADNVQLRAKGTNFSPKTEVAVNAEINGNVLSVTVTGDAGTVLVTITTSNGTLVESRYLNTAPSDGAFILNSGTYIITIETSVGEWEGSFAVN